MPTGGELLVQALRTLDVEVAFGLPGVHNLAAWKGFPGSGVRLVGVRHEQTAGYAADGYARATGRLGVAVTTTGPGAANVITATGEAWSCHSPLLVIATDIPTTLRREGAYRGVLHETVDQASFFRPVTKAQVRVDTVEDLYDAVLRAGRLAMQHPRRPVYLEVPTDLLTATAGQPGPELDAAPAVVRHVVVDPLVPLLAAAQRPVVWAGGGATASDAGDLVAELGLRLGAPVLTSYGGRGLVPVEHPSHVGLPPHVAEVGRLWDEADCVVVLGSDLDFMNTQGFRQPRPPSLVVLDLGDVPNAEPDVHLHVDVAAGLRDLLAALPVVPRAPWWSQRQVHEAGRAALSAQFPAELALLSALTARSRRRRSSSPTCASRATGTAVSARSGRLVGWPTRSVGGPWGSASPPRSGLRCPADRRSRWSVTAASCSPAETWPRRPRSSCPSPSSW